MSPISRRNLLSSWLAASASSLIAHTALSQAGALLADSPARPDAQATQQSNVLNIQTNAIKGPLPHVWEECVGSDRAVVGLRQQWLSDVDLVKKSTGIKTVRFHGLFNDEMGVYPRGAKKPNFLYIDMVFDAILARCVRPLVELSFMPAALANGDRSILWYKGNTTPPVEFALWAS